MAILANRRNLFQSSPKVRIKPNMSKEQRDTDKVLLKERKLIIHNSATRRDVKVRGNRLYVGQRLHGTANTHSFPKYPTLGDSAPLLNKQIPTQGTSTVLFEQTDENQASFFPKCLTPTSTHPNHSWILEFQKSG